MQADSVLSSAPSSVINKPFVNLFAVLLCKRPFLALNPKLMGLGRGGLTKVLTHSRQSRYCKAWGHDGDRAVAYDWASAMHLQPKSTAATLKTRLIGEFLAASCATITNRGAKGNKTLFVPAHGAVTGALGGSPAIDPQHFCPHQRLCSALKPCCREYNQYLLFITGSRRPAGLGDRPPGGPGKTY